MRFFLRAIATCSTNVNGLPIAVLVLYALVLNLAGAPMFGPSMASLPERGGLSLEISGNAGTDFPGSLETLVDNDGPDLLKKGNYRLTFNMFDISGTLRSSHSISPYHFVFPYRSRTFSVDIPSDKLSGAVRIVAVLTLEGADVARSLPFSVFPDLTEGYTVSVPPGSGDSLSRDGDSPGPEKPFIAGKAETSNKGAAPVEPKDDKAAETSSRMVHAAKYTTFFERDAVPEGGFVYRTRALRNRVEEIFAKIIARDNYNDLAALIARYRKDPALTIRLSGSAIEELRPFESDLLDLIDVFVENRVEREEMKQLLTSLLSRGNQTARPAVARKPIRVSKPGTSPRSAKSAGSGRRVLPRAKTAETPVKAKDSPVSGDLGNASGKARMIVVKPGDSLYALSKRHLGSGDLFGAVAEVNELNEPYIILPGQRLLLPMTAKKTVARAAIPVTTNPRSVEKVMAARSNRIAEAKKEVGHELAETRAEESSATPGNSAPPEIEPAPGRNDSPALGTADPATPALDGTTTSVPSVSTVVSEADAGTELTYESDALAVQRTLETSAGSKGSTLIESGFTGSGIASAEHVAARPADPGPTLKTPDRGELLAVLNKVIPEEPPQASPANETSPPEPAGATIEPVGSHRPQTQENSPGTAGILADSGPDATPPGDTEVAPDPNSMAKPAAEAETTPALPSAASTILSTDLAWYYNFFNHLLILTLLSLIILGSVYYSNYVKQKNALKFAHLYEADPLTKL